MSERDSYSAGVPCWVEDVQEDPQAAADFYGSLFGWELVGPGSAVATGDFQYFVARLRGRDVAGVASLPESGDGLRPSWVTHVRVESADATCEAAREAGGTVLDGPFDAAPAGRLAVLADPASALFCVWQADIREGAQLVNEPGAWAMSALQTTDPDHAAAFYRAVFGWEAEAFGPVHLLRLPGYVGGTPDQPVPRDVVAVMAPLARCGRPLAMGRRLLGARRRGDGRARGRARRSRRGAGARPSAVSERRAGRSWRRRLLDQPARGRSLTVNRETARMPDSAASDRSDLRP